MKHATRMLAAMALGCCMLNNMAHASIIKSMTIEEIGVVSGGLGTSAVSNRGGEFFVFGGPADSGFGSAGSLDGAIIMGQAQGVNAFTPGFTLYSGPALPHTLNGAPSGSITGGTMTLDLSGWGTRWVNIEFVLFPDAGTLLTSVSQLDASHYYYTADWSHVITSAEGTPFTGISTSWHLEGIATVPEPSTLWLFGASALGLILSRCRKHA
ncbi:MAG: PEP-CTERM sorting domain-containing protein [Thiobacillus sp.]